MTDVDAKKTISVEFMASEPGEIPILKLDLTEWLTQVLGGRKIRKLVFPNSLGMPVGAEK